MFILPQIDSDEELSPDDADEILNGKNLLDNDNQRGLTNDTQHTGTEKPTFTLPISENPLNYYAYRLKFRTGEVEDLSSITMLNKLRHYYHNYPKKIICDEGKEFKNTLQINLHFTTNYNANSNSPIESTLLEKIRTLKHYSPFMNKYIKNN